MSVGTYRIGSRCCACCRWWNGPRAVDFNGGGSPRYVKAESGLYDCIATKSKKSAATVCPRFCAWEKL